MIFCIPRLSRAPISNWGGLGKTLSCFFPVYEVASLDVMLGEAILCLGAIGFRSLFPSCVP
jgi:hypothetical protein